MTPAISMQNLLRRLLMALLADNTAAAEKLVDVDEFVASLPGSSELTWEQFLAEFKRRRKPFSDFGRNVEELAITSGHDVVMVYYRMTVTNDGPLEAHDASYVVPPNGKTIVFESVDIARFNEHGMIISLTVIADRTQTLFQIG